MQICFGLDYFSFWNDTKTSPSIEDRSLCWLFWFSIFLPQTSFVLVVTKNPIKLLWSLAIFTHEVDKNQNSSCSSVWSVHQPPHSFSANVNDIDFAQQTLFTNEVMFDVDVLASFWIKIVSQFSYFVVRNRIKSAVLLRVPPSDNDFWSCFINSAMAFSFSSFAASLDLSVTFTYFV